MREMPRVSSSLALPKKKKGQVSLLYCQQLPNGVVRKPRDPSPLVSIQRAACLPGNLHHPFFFPQVLLSFLIFPVFSPAFCAANWWAALPRVPWLANIPAPLCSMVFVQGAEQGSRAGIQCGAVPTASDRQQHTGMCVAVCQQSQHNPWVIMEISVGRLSCRLGSLPTSPLWWVLQASEKVLSQSFLLLFIYLFIILSHFNDTVETVIFWNFCAVTKANNSIT